MGTITLTNRPVYYATNLSARDVYAAEQFLKPLERYDLDINNHITTYHDNRGAIGLQSVVGTTNVRIGTDLITIFYLLNALRDWWQRKEAEATIQSYDTAYVTIKKTPEEKEAIHCGSINRLKDDLTQKVPRWNDAHLLRKEEILQDWKHGQEKALKKYIAYLAKTQTPQRMRQLVEAKRSAEQQIETFNLELDAIKAEQLNRLHKKNSSKNTNAIYASNSGNCASPGGKDPKDKKNGEHNKKPHPNGIYKEAKYHHTQSRGQKSPAPKNGQLALDNSLDISNTTSRRIGLENDYFVVFDQTQPATTNSPAEFHGHIRHWEDLTDGMRTVLQKEGWVSPKGKILL